MSNQNNAKRELIEALELSIKGRPESFISKELQHAIEGCNTMEELKALLFGIGSKNSATMEAFDQKIDELEQSL